MKAIGAMSRNRAIGLDSGLPWHIPEDLRWYRKTTSGQMVVMGRKTFMPLRTKLDDCEVVVISRSLEPIPGVKVLQDVEAVKTLKTDKEIWICGGAEIYAQTLAFCSDLYLTLVKREVEGDAFFPPFEHLFDHHAVIRDEAEFTIHHYRAKKAQ